MTKLAIRIMILGSAMFLETMVARTWADTPINTLVWYNFYNGGEPAGGVVLSADGTTLYGTTTDGGSGGYGTVFSLPTVGGIPTELASFDGTLGANPVAGLVLSGTTLYGTTVSGGAFGYGTIFSVPSTGGTPTILASFDGTNLAKPFSRLTLSGNTLYGTTAAGGSNGRGTVYSVPITGGTPTVLASFNFENGDGPAAGLTLADNKLYGTTQSGGGDGNFGSVFSVPITGGTITVLGLFDGDNGGGPVSNLTLLNGTLYGTAQIGGPSDAGTVFSIPINGGTVTVLASFDGNNGAGPFAGLTLSHDGKTLFGTTYGGGASGNGTIFSIPIAGGPITVLASFNGLNGGLPESDLVLSTDGNTLFGTSAGGDYGTLFSISLPEPANLVVLGIGVGGMLLRRKKKVPHVTAVLRLRSKELVPGARGAGSE